MNSDSIFTIGNEHSVCQDYALGGQTSDMAYAIISDGCSASEDVDIGARMLTLAAKNTLLLPTEYDKVEFGKVCIENAVKITNIFSHLHPTCLDATLLATWVKGNRACAYLYGDGVFVHRKANGDVRSIHIEVTSGAPDYLSYSLDPRRRSAYDTLDENYKIVIHSFLSDPIIYKPFDPVMVQADVGEGDILAVISDGINSFRTADKVSIPWSELIDEFTGFKNFEGEFVNRRISAFKRKCVRDGITHYDDISIAAIVV